MKHNLRNEVKATIKIKHNIKTGIEILNMSYFDLVNTIKEGFDSNPFLEVEYEYLDDNFEGTSYYSNNNSSDRASEYDELNNISTDKSLYEHISDQIKLEFIDEEDRRIAYSLLEMIDAKGRLEIVNLQLISGRLNTSINALEAVLKKLQCFDPPGIFARDLKECLRMQLISKNICDEKFDILIDNLELVAKLQYEKLLKILDVKIERLMSMIKQIKTLNPNPTAAFDSEPSITKIPEVLVKIKNDVISVEINPSVLPKFSINKDYYKQIKSCDENGKNSELVSEEYNNAINLVNGVKNRFKTLLLVAKTIVEQQKEFLLKGIMYLKPMRLQRIAELTSLHESTISRTINHKYMLTPYGIYELKYFFSSQIKTNSATLSSSAESESSTKVKEYIKELIADEGSNILSDEEISITLEKFGFKVARRTVAKYRESLGIATSAIRKRQKKIVL